MLLLFVDGGCSGNDQKDLSKRTMVSVVTDQSGKVLSEIQNHGGSNNLAEFIALEAALRYALENKQRQVEIVTDSMTIVSWFNRDDSKLKPKVLNKMNDPEWYSAVKAKIDELKQYIDVDLYQRPREENLAGHYIEEKYSL